MESEPDEVSLGPEFSHVLEDPELSVEKLLAHCDFLDNLEMQTSGLMAL